MRRLSRLAVRAVAVPLHSPLLPSLPRAAAAAAQQLGPRGAVRHASGAPKEVPPNPEAQKAPEAETEVPSDVYGPRFGAGAAELYWDLRELVVRTARAHTRPTP